MPDMMSAGQSLPATRTEAVVGELRRLIISGDLPGGTRLRQNDIARRFGVSTTPVREAITALAREGLVQQDPHRGAIVFAPVVEDVLENFGIRGALETHAAAVAAQAITDSELQTLTALLDVMRVKIHEDSRLHTTELNPRFHYLVNAAARRPRLLSMIEAARATALSYHALLDNYNTSFEYRCTVQHEHEEIVEALGARDSNRVAEVVKVHIDNNLEQILSRMPAVAPPA